MKAPTCEELFDDELEEVHRDADDSWRHGCYVWQVFAREDGTFWGASYDLSSDGESNGLREGTADICQVWPKRIVKIEYVKSDPASEGQQ